MFRWNRSARRCSLPPLDLSFARDFRTIIALQWSCTVTIVAALGVGCWLWRDTDQLNAQAAQYERAAERVRATTREFIEQARRDGFSLSDAREKVLVREVAFAKRYLAHQAFSWTQFLSDLEETVPASVSINSVALDFKESIISLDGAASTLTDLTTFVDRLETHPAFHSVVLAQHTITHDAEQEAMKGSGRQDHGVVDFRLTVTYHPKGS